MWEKIKKIWEDSNENRKIIIAISLCLTSVVLVISLARMFRPNKNNDLKVKMGNTCACQLTEETEIPKGYWLSTGSIKNREGMQPYLKSLKSWLPSVNGKFLVRDAATIQKEKNLGHLTVIIEFPSKEDAVSAYESEEYLRMIPLRTPYSDLTLTIFEGV